MAPTVPIGKVYRPSQAIARCLNAQTTFRLLIGPRGEGKCLQPGTPILMADGTVRPVEYVVHGDQVMGMEGHPRTVLGQHSGHSTLLEVIPENGQPFVVTDDHWLTVEERTMPGADCWHLTEYRAWAVQTMLAARPLDFRLLRRQEDRTLVTVPLRTIRDAGRGRYAGFAVDGDHRFCLGDGTVTHNTTGALMTIYTYALQQPPQRWPLIVACVRDTRTNIGITTAPSIKEWWPEGLASSWTGKAFAPEVAEIQHDSGATLLRFHFFGCDSTSDMNRFQSFECDVLYVEEPAPAAGVSGGISGDVVGVAITSQRRESLALVVVASNPPDGEHWVAQVWGLPGAIDAEWDEDRRQAIQWIRQRSTIVRLRPGDNAILTQRQPEYRERNREVLTAFGRTDLVNRLVEGEVGTVQEGEKVASAFTPAHIVDVCPVLPVGARVVMSWDPRQHPCCILWYVRPGGLCWVLAAWQGMNRGVRQLITQAILPWLALHVGHKEYSIIHTGDPNTLTEDQSDSAVTATKVILSLLGGVQWVPGPVGIEERRLPLHDCLNLYVQGRPWVQISREHCAVLIKALEGGWYYPKDAAGRVIKEKWAKNASSDVGEAFAYGCSFLQRQKGETSTMERWRQKLSQQARQRQRGGWAGTGA